MKVHLFSLNLVKKRNGQLPSRERGFALIATIAVMALMAVTALAMLSLSTVEVRSSNHGGAMADARANARMALMIALGELQKSAGPDQRVTAEGDIDSSPGFGKAHWVGVWSSEDADSDDVADGSFEGWLVSKDDDALANGYSYEDVQAAAADETDDDWVEMVGEGSVDVSADSKAQVMAPRVIINDENGEQSGSYAWWVGDEGVKARIDLQNTQDDVDLASQSSPRPAIEVISGLDELDSESNEMVKIISLKSLSQVEGMDQDLVIDHFHNLTASSRSLMTDNRNGGFKKDLSLLFEMTDQDYEDEDPADYAEYVNANTPVSGSGTEEKGLLFRHEGVFGPTMDTLRNQYRLYKENQGSAEEPLFSARASYPNKTELGADSWNRTACVLSWKNGITGDPAIEENTSVRYWGGNGTSRPSTRLLHGNLTPYLNRVMMYVSAEAVSTGTPGKYDIQLRFQPILYIHNPYNVDIQVDGMRYLKTLRDAKLWVIKDNKLIKNPKIRRGLGSVDFLTLVANSGGTISENNGEGGQAEFVINGPINFEAGEVKMFVPNGKVPWGTQMPMVQLANGFQPDEMAMTVDLRAVGDPTDVGIASLLDLDADSQLKMLFTWQEWSKQDFEILENDRGGYNTVWSGMTRTFFPAPADTNYDSFDGEASDDWNTIRGLRAYPVGHYTPIKPVTIEDVMVKAAKFDTPDETNKESVPAFIHGNPLCSSDSNMLAARVPRPGASLYSAHTYGFYDQPDNEYEAVTQSELDAAGVSTWGSHNGSQGERYSTVLAIPTAPMQSLGQLQHTNVAHRGHMPALAIANSFPNLSMTSFDNLVEEVSGETQYDLSYLCNEALWDSYFFSSIGPKPDDSSYSSTADPSSDMESLIEEVLAGEEQLNNMRFTISGDSTTAEQEKIDSLLDYKSSAAYLYLDGGFNVNSTNIEAWKAVLSAYRDSSLRTAGGEEELDDVSAFPRAAFSAGEPVEKSRGADDDSWLSFAELDDDEIASLAEEIVEGIRDRFATNPGETPMTPYLTLGQFVNRTPSSNDAEQQSMGLIQYALEESGINSSIEDIGMFESDEQGSGNAYEVPFEGDAADYEIPLAASSPSYVLQGDVLQAIGASITVRSDTFVIRSYGSADDANGNLIAQAWCEAVVQRTAVPVEPDATNPMEVADGATNKARRFKIVSFRWLNKDEV